MPTCIYCLEHKPSEKFDNEHVLTRAFCGQGKNWTLVDIVCRECNGKMSAFESHWTQSAVESVMRNFSGPKGRSSKSTASRMQPTEIDNLYIVQRGDSLAYEAGFAFPNQFYFRPQILVSNKGLVSIAANLADGELLKQAVTTLTQMPSLQLCQPKYEDGARKFTITELLRDAKTSRYVINAQSEDRKPNGYWIRDYPEPPTVADFDGNERKLTPRLALDDRKRLYFRVQAPHEAIEILDNLIQGNMAPQANSPEFRADDQTLRIGINIKLPLLFRAVMKTGMNLVAHQFGAELVRGASFDEARRLLFHETEDDEVVRRSGFLRSQRFSICEMFRSSIPPAPTTSEHRLMLDIHNGKLWFRMRLYGSLGYQCALANVTPEIKNTIFTTRVIVDFETTGIKKVEKWP